MLYSIKMELFLFGSYSVPYSVLLMVTMGKWKWSLCDVNVVFTEICKAYYSWNCYNFAFNAQ